MKSNEVGSLIRFYRKKKSLTQQELAEKIGVTWEMISRYERGHSSALNVIPDLAEALGISSYKLLQEPNQLRDSGQIQYNSQVPLFVKIPESENFSFDETKFYYSAPQWVINLDKKVFAIDSELVDINTLQLKKKGIIYVAPDIEPSGQDLALYWNGPELEADTCGSIERDHKVIGKVLAQEVRFSKSTE